LLAQRLRREACAENVGSEHICFEEYDKAYDDEYEHGYLYNSKKGVDYFCRLDAARHDVVHKPDESRTEQHGLPTVIVQAREEGAERVVEHHSVCHIGEGCAQPVAPCDIEAYVIAETCLGILVYTGIVLRIFVAQPFE